MLSYMSTDVPKLGKVKYEKGGSAFYLSTGPVLQNGMPLVGVSRWEADDVLMAIEEKYSVKEKLSIPTVHDSFMGASKNNKILKSMFSYPAEWQRNLVLNPNTPGENEDYVLMNVNGKVLNKSRHARNIIPAEIHNDGNRKIVKGEVFEIPFDIKNGRFDLSDVDPSTGFPTKKSGEGRFGIRFIRSEGLYGTILRDNGDLVCHWRPASKGEDLGMRVCYKRTVQ